MSEPQEQGKLRNLLGRLPGFFGEKAGQAADTFETELKAELGIDDTIAQAVSRIINNSDFDKAGKIEVFETYNSDKVIELVHKNGTAKKKSEIASELGQAINECSKDVVVSLLAAEKDEYGYVMTISDTIIPIRSEVEQTAEIHILHAA